MRANRSIGSSGKTSATAKDEAGRDGSLPASGSFDLGAAIWNAISRLEPRSRRVFLMIRFEHYSQEYTAASLGMSRAEVKLLLAKATQNVNTGIGAP